MSLPRPLPPSPPTPPSLPYAIPSRQPRQTPVFSWTLFLWTEAMFIALIAILVFVVPRFMDIFRDFHVQPPLALTVLVGLAKLVYYGGFVVLLAFPVGIGFLGGALQPAGRRALRVVITLLMAAFIVYAVIAIFQPLLTLIEGMSSHK